MEGKSNNVDLILQACLEKILSGQGTLDSVLAEVPEQADVLRPELEAALWLAAITPALDPRPGFLAASRRRLVAQISRKRPPDPSPFQKLALLFQRRFVFQASLAILLVMVLLTGNILSAAARQAIPGDALYTLKTFNEETRLAFSFTHTSQARLRIEFARRRISEVEELALEGRYQAASTTLAGFDQQVSQAVALLDEIKQTDSVEAQVLAVSLNQLINDQADVTMLLTASAPAGMKPELDAAVQSSTDRMASLRDELLDLVVNPIATATALGPTPGETATSLLGGSPSAQPGHQGAPNTATSSPSRTPRPSNTSDPTPLGGNPGTPKPSNTPKPTFTPRPSNTPRSTNTPRPSNTPQPTHTPRSSNTPQPTRTPKSTDPPHPTNTHKPPQTEAPTSTLRPTKTSKP